MHEAIVRLKVFFTAYRQEGILMAFSSGVILVGLVCLALAFRASTSQVDERESIVSPQPTPTQLPTPQKKREEITIDVSGAVKEPDTYVLVKGARLADALEMAGGLSLSADTDYFYRNYNNARYLVDQEKIYIPRRDETEGGVFVEDAYYVEQGSITAKVSPTAVPVSQASAGLLSINTATQAEIEDLPGIGPVSATKLIQNRPYSHFEDLRTRSGLSESAITKFQDQISYE